MTALWGRLETSGEGCGKHKRSKKPQTFGMTISNTPQIRLALIGSGSVNYFFSLKTDEFSFERQSICSKEKI
jgi:hypothetical protein